VAAARAAAAVLPKVVHDPPAVFAPAPAVAAPVRPAGAIDPDALREFSAALAPKVVDPSLSPRRWKVTGLGKLASIVVGRYMDGNKVRFALVPVPPVGKVVLADPLLLPATHGVALTDVLEWFGRREPPRRGTASAAGEIRMPKDADGAFLLLRADQRRSDTRGEILLLGIREELGHLKLVLRRPLRSFGGPTAIATLSGPSFEGGFGINSLQIVLIQHATPNHPSGLPAEPTKVVCHYSGPNRNCR